MKNVAAISVNKDATDVKPLQQPLRLLKPSVTAAMPTVRPEGTQDGKEQDTGPR